MNSGVLRKWHQIYWRGWRNIATNSPTASGDGYLIVQLAALGDVCTLIQFCLNQPAFQERIDVVCRSAFSPLWRHFLPQAKVMGVDQERWSYPQGGNWAEITEKHYQAVFVTSLSAYAVFLASFARADFRCGMIEGGRRYKGSRLLLDRVYQAGVNEHVIRRFGNLFSLQPIDIQAAPPADKAPISKTPGPIVLHPGAKWKPRRWPVERFAELAREIADQGQQVRLALHPSETDLLASLEGTTRISDIEIIRTESLDDLIALVSSCSVFIGNDSGPAHLANLLGKPTIVLWGPGNFERIRPLGDNVRIIKEEISCRPCRQYIHDDRCERGENLCLQRIEVRTVLDTLAKLQHRTPS